MAPHVTEEIWRALGHTTSIHLEAWPKFDPNLVLDEMVTVVVQINGKVRDRLEVPAGTTEDDVRALALDSECSEASPRQQPPKKIHLHKKQNAKHRRASQLRAASDFMVMDSRHLR